jgi:hypothetical protein
VASLTFGLCVALLTLLAAFGPQFLSIPEFSMNAMLGLDALLVVLLIVSILRGPTCITEVFTRVHSERILCLNRWRTAQQFVSKVRPLVEAAQGTMTSEQLLGAGAAADGGLALPASTCSEPERIHRHKASIRHDSGVLHLVLFSAVLVFMFTDMMDLYLFSHIKNMLDAVLFSLFLLFNVYVMVRQRDTDLPGDLRALVSATLLVKVVYYYVARSFLYGMVMFASFSAGRQPTAMSFEIDQNMPGYYPMIVTSMLVNAALALAGLIAVLRWVRIQRLYPPQPVSAA